MQELEEQLRGLARPGTGAGFVRGADTGGDSSSAAEVGDARDKSAVGPLQERQMQLVEGLLQRLEAQELECVSVNVSPAAQLVGQHHHQQQQQQQQEKQLQ